MNPPDLFRRGAAFLAAAALMTTSVAHAGKCHDQQDRKALAADPSRAETPIAPVLEGLGDHHHPVTTRVPRAQIFFDQGLKLTYAFNHQEALRTFKEAARLDPDCAMAYWGWALVLGPNLNLPMKEDVVPQAFEAIQKAMSLRDKVSERERAYIEALALRYGQDPKADRVPLDEAYAAAMKRLHEAYPEDTDAATLYGAAVMNLSPWNYWSRDGRPRPNTPALLAAFDAALARDPRHEGALHYKIHALEAVHPLGILRMASVPAAASFVGSWVTHPVQLSSAAMWAFVSDRSGEMRELADRSMPCHVLWAERDTVLSRNDGAEFARRLNATFTIAERPPNYPPIDHDWMFDDPELFVQHLEELDLEALPTA